MEPRSYSHDLEGHGFMKVRLGDLASESISCI